MDVMKVEGIDNILHNFDVILEASITGARKGIDQAAEDILEDAKEYAPKDTGNLVESAYFVSTNNTSIATPTFSNANGDASALYTSYTKHSTMDNAIVKSSILPMAIIAFTAPYANIIHEINKNYKVGRWKYLESALKKRATTISSKVANGVKAEIYRARKKK